MRRLALTFGGTIFLTKTSSVVTVFSDQGEANEFSMEVEDRGFSTTPQDVRTMEVHEM